MIIQILGILNYFNEVNGFKVFWRFSVIGTNLAGAQGHPPGTIRGSPSWRSGPPLMHGRRHTLCGEIIICYVVYNIRHPGSLRHTQILEASWDIPNTLSSLRHPENSKSFKNILNVRSFIAHSHRISFQGIEDYGTSLELRISVIFWSEVRSSSLHLCQTITRML